MTVTRKTDPKRGALTRFRIDPCSTIVQLHYLAHNRQAHPRAVKRIVDAMKQSKHRLVVLEGNAWSPIAHEVTNFPVVRFCPNVDRSPRVGTAIFDGIGDEIEKQLKQ